MSDQSELACVSCETAFDPAPTGGFCPDCDTPHPDFEHGEADDEGDVEQTEAEESEAGGADAEPDDDAETAPSSDDAAPSYCRDCGAEIGRRFLGGHDGVLGVRAGRRRRRLVLLQLRNRTRSRRVGGRTRGRTDRRRGRRRR